MKKSFFLGLVILLAFTLCGCQNTKTRAVEGGVIGGVLGAVAGGIIGHQSDHGVEGAAIGAAVGAIGGAVVGGQVEKPAAESQSVPVNATVNP